MIGLPVILPVTYYNVTCDRFACEITCDRVACGSGFVLLPRLFCTAGPEHSHADWQTK